MNAVQIGLVVIVIVIMIIFVIYTETASTEGYTQAFSNQDFSSHALWDPRWVGKIAPDCYKLNKDTCNNYTNCGLCIKDGEFKCLPGDQDGPLFKEKCYRWLYTDYIDSHVYGQKRTNISPPGDYFYRRYYEARYPSPQSVATLFY